MSFEALAWRTLAVLVLLGLAGIGVQSALAAEDDPFLGDRARCINGVAYRLTIGGRGRDTLVPAIDPVTLMAMRCRIREPDGAVVYTVAPVDSTTPPRRAP